jgi:ComF family protein
MFLTKLIRAIHPFFNQLLPATCILCGHAPHALCFACLQSLPILSHHCPRCAKFLSNNRLCGKCLKNPPFFDALYACFPYEFPIIQLITELKFQHKLSHARVLSHLLITHIQQVWYANQPLPDFIIPVPLHPKRLQKRGFNQAIEIAKPISRALRIPLDIHGLQRKLDTAAQSRLSAKERRHNIANAFQAHRDYTGLTIALIDDVVTTTQTITACCKALKRSGAKKIHVWCVARRG